MKRYLPFVLIALVAVAAVSAGTMLYRAKVAALTPTASDSNAKAITERLSAKETHVRGSAKALVTVEEYGDFQCPPCGLLAPTLLRLEHEFEAQLRVVYRHFPLAIHNHAAEASRAAEAAGMQEKFWDMHDRLYAEQAVWAKETDVKPRFLTYAEQLGLDRERFEKDYDGPEGRARVSADQARGESLGVTSTPTLFINSRPLPASSLNEPALRAAITAVIRGEPLPTPTPSPTPMPTPSPLPIQ